MTVAATDLNGRSSYFSNANAAIDLSAPGEQVATAVPVAHDPDGDGNGYALVDGTSFAAPIVAGAATWVAAVRPRLSVDQLAQVVRLSAQDLGRPGWDPHTGYGMLQVGAALRMQAPRERPARAERGHLLGQRGRVQQPRPDRLRRQALAGAASGRGSTSTRTRPTCTASASRVARARGSRSCRATATPTSRSSAVARGTPPRARSAARSAAAPRATRS